MSGRKNPLRITARKSFDTAEVQTLYLERVPETQLWCVQRFVFEGSKSTGGGHSQCRWYIDKGDEPYYLGWQDNPQELVTYVDPVTFWLAAGERLALEWDEGKVETFLEAWITGYWVGQLAGIVT